MLKPLFHPRFNTMRTLKHRIYFMNVPILACSRVEESIVKKQLVFASNLRLNFKGYLNYAKHFLTLLMDA